MVKERVPRKLWEYEVIWVSELMPMTHYLENSVNIGTALTNITGKNVDISKYLEFDLYDKIWLKENVVIYPIEPGGCLGIPHRTGGLF